MPDDKTDPTIPVEPDLLHFTIRHALLHNGKRRFDSAREFMADITAEHLIEALRMSGMVVIRRPPSAPAGPSVPDDRT